MREIAQRELRNDIGTVLRSVEAGEAVVVTVDRRPVAMLSPLPQRRTWQPAHQVLARLGQADSSLTAELDDLLGDTSDDL